MRDDAAVIALTVKWLERAVIGLNLCPFAKSVHIRGQIHYAVSFATTQADLLEVLETELNGLQAHEATARDTTLLIAPSAFSEFLDFNDFLPHGDRLLRQMKFDGIFQIAGFHPKFQFSGTEPDEITNFTNRAPFPILHLLRENSIDRAVEAFPEPETIFHKNMRTLENLGVQGWDALGLKKTTTLANTVPQCKIAP